MQHSKNNKMRNIMAGSLVAVLTSFGAAATAGAVAYAEPGIPAPSLPDIDPTAPPLPGGGG